VVTVALPEDRGLRGGGARVRRFRSHLVELGARLRDFRLRYGLTQAAVAGVIGLGARSAICRWETGAAVPDGVPRERLKDLLAGRLWPDLRAAAITGPGLPGPWEQAVRWYRRGSRERRLRETAGTIVTAILNELRAAESTEGLRRWYVEHDGDRARGVAATQRISEPDAGWVRRIEDAAYGLRWLELTHGVLLDPRRSLAAQLPPGLHNGAAGRARER
jgi:transcriptional regulator with XRE-family HTH domain